MDFFSIASNGLWSVSTITSRCPYIGIDGNAHNHKLLQAFLFQSVSSSADMKLTLSTHTLLDDHFEEALHPYLSSWHQPTGTRVLSDQRI